MNQAHVKSASLSELMVLVTISPLHSVVIISVFYTISHGINSYKNHTKINGSSTHAEHDAILRLPVRKSKKLKKINILVIKTTKTGVIGNSKPCFDCINHMLNLAPKYGYKINYVYYSTDKGDIEQIKLKELYARGDFHYSAYYKFKNKIKLLH